MVDAAPFAALRYDPAVAGDPASTSAPAYDDVERFTYARHRAASPYTVLELLAGEDDGTAEAYAAPGAAYRRWVRTGVLVEDPAPAYYLYDIHELRGGVPYVLRGVIAAVDVAEGNLIPHEAVDPQRVAARVRRMAAVPADLAPVFAVHTAAPSDMRAVIDGAPPGPPVIAFTDEAGVDHRIWALRDPGAVESVRRGLAGVRAVIADGHHRYAAAVQRRSGDPAAGRALTYLVDASAYGPQLQAVHRIVRPAPRDLLERLQSQFTVTQAPDAGLAAVVARKAAPAFGLVRGGQAPAVVVARDPEALRHALPPGHSSEWARLDAAVWEHVVRPMLGAVSVSYRTDATLTEADDEDEAAAFVLRPPSLSDVFACALAGEALPAKSTSFRPKPRAGLVMRSLESNG